MKANTKRILALLCAMAMLMMVVLAGCGSDSSNGGGGGEGGETAASGGLWDGVSFDLDMQTHLSSTEQMNSSYGHMIALIDQVTDGAVKITAFENGSLYSVGDTLSALQSGDLIVAESAEGYWSDNLPVTLLAAGLPFIYNSYEQAYMFMVNRGFIDIMNEAYAEYNVHCVPFEVYTASIISKSPITSVADMQGMKLRASGSMALYEELVGAAVTNVSGSELYNALSTGVVDGATWGSAQAMLQMNLQETVKYYMDPDPICGQWNNIYFNLDWWNALTVDQQNCIEFAIEMSGYSRTVATEANNVLAKQLFTDKYGVTIQTLDNDAIAEFSEYGWQLLDQFAQADEYSARGVEALQNFIDEYNHEVMVYTEQIYFNHPFEKK